MITSFEKFTEVGWMVFTNTDGKIVIVEIPGYST